jgi:PelA/Pel-15E family pectate lyase
MRESPATLSATVPSPPGTMTMDRSTARLRFGAMLGVLLIAGGFVGSDTQVRWGTAALRQKPEWYASPEARAMAENVIRWQSAHGGWPKNTDLAARPPVPQGPAGTVGRDGADTIDNGATTTPMRFLALMVQATRDTRYGAPFDHGVDYLLAAQYPNGGWPQYFPLRKGYYSHITYNDDAMVNVLRLLRDVAAGKPPYDFVDPARRARAASAVTRGIDCILHTQIKQNGKLTAWCAQHDETTLEPAWGRNYEPPTLSGGESVGIVRFLMEIEQPSPEIVAAIDGAVAWFEDVAIHGVRLEEFTGADGKRDKRVLTDPAARPLWARFYERGTNRPVFTGRDQVIRYAISEIEHERRNGYSYYVTSPSGLLANDYLRWCAKLKPR